jgi:pullulanase
MGRIFMQKRLKAILMAVIMVAFTVCSMVRPADSVKAATQLTVNIHYHRYAGDYEGWNIWSWVRGADGASFEFNGEDEFGRIASYQMEVEDDVTDLGFIVRHSTPSNAWDLKDTNNDRFMDLANVKDGVIDVYVVQDMANFGYSSDEMR